MGIIGDEPLNLIDQAYHKVLSFSVKWHYNVCVMAKKKSTKSSSNTIAVNRKARYEYALEHVFEAGLVLEGWEVKSLREGKANVAESHVIIKKGEAFLLGSQITPLLSASTHINPDSTRTRKLLLHRRELNQMIGAVERKGYTIVPTKLYWSKGRVKCEVAIAKGKKLHDKRETIKQRDWERSKSRILRNS